MTNPPKEKHTVHCRDGGKVVIDGDRVEVHLTGPLVFERKHWIKWLSPREEASRALNYAGTSPALRMLEEAFQAVPMTVYQDSTDD